MKSVIILAAVLLALLAFSCISATAFETLVKDGSVTVNGKASPDERIRFKASFQMHLPASAGQYEYETSITVPQKPNKFTLQVRDVLDLNAGVKMGIWLTKRFEASNGQATLSHADIPPGSYTIKIFGQALPGISKVPVEVTAETEVKADANGDFSLDIDTSGVPAGEYTIQGAGQSKKIQVNGAIPSSPSSGGAASGSAGSYPGLGQEDSASLAITKEVVEWYASKLGLNATNSTQLADAEKQLKTLVKDGYWKVISQGDPLTEESGDCLKQYCLVRGKDACRSCREKDQILHLEKPSLSIQREPESEPQNPGNPGSQPENLITKLLSWLTDFFLGGLRQ